MGSDAIISGMGRPKERPPRKPETETQEVFLKRVQEELEGQHLSRAEVARRGEMNQKSFNDVMNGAVPKLTQIHKIAKGLGVHVSELFRGKKAGATHQENLTGKVRYLPRLPKIFGDAPNSRTQGKTSTRNKSR